MSAERHVLRGNHAGSRLYSCQRHCASHRSYNDSMIERAGARALSIQSCSGAAWRSKAHPRRRGRAWDPHSSVAVQPAGRLLLGNSTPPLLTASTLPATLAAATPAATMPDEGSPLHKTVKEMRNRLERAVWLELQEQQQQQQAANSRLSVRRLEADGLVLVGLLAQPKGRLYSDFVWSFSLPSHAKLPYHRFKHGDTVILMPVRDGRSMNASGSRHDNGSGINSNTVDGSASSTMVQQQVEVLEGTVLEVGGAEIQITVVKPAAEALGAASPGTQWQCNQGASSTTVQRQLAAISRLDVLLDPTCKGEAAVRGVLLGSHKAEQVAALPTAWSQSEEWKSDAVKHLRVQQSLLNRSQLAAVVKAMTRTYTLWQGPPGTGKTRTLLAFVEVMVRAVADAPLRRRQQGAVLAVADTNAAADNMLEGLLERGIQAVRVGQPAKVRPGKLRDACIDALVERTPAGQRAAKLRANADILLQQKWQIQQQLQALQTQQAQQGQHAWQGQQGRGVRRTATVPELKRMASDIQIKADSVWRRAEKLVADEAINMLQQAPVVVATCNGAGESRLAKQCFRIVVMDEASQATEPASLVPLVKGAECVVMAGDQRQLPPTVLSQLAIDKYQLDMPLFTRLLEGGVSSLLLEVQYRMHPAIAAFPSQHFYADRVRSGVTQQDRPPIKGVPWSNPNCPVHFINVNGREQQTASRGDQQPQGTSGGGGGASYSNLDEAEIAMKALVRLLQCDQSIESITLLSPYSGQVRLLNSMLNKAELPEGAAHRCAITVSTVDGYQGREADVVIFSAVRCNSAGAVGFLRDERRLNVAITRARRGLIVIGNEATLQIDPNWCAWMRWLAAQRLQRQQQPPSSAD